VKPDLDRLYDYVTGDEDARVCRDIPEAACRHQPRNFFAYLLANLLNKVADEITSAKLVLPWMLGALGAPVALTGFLVPIREAGVLLPQLAVAAAVRHRPRRKGVWLLGGALSGLALAGMAFVAGSLEGAAAGWAVIALLVVFSLARGLCSVAAKDVLGKTVSKSRRGALMGTSAGLGGVAVLLVGLALGATDLAAAGDGVFVALLLGAALLWGVALASFAAIVEEPGATEGGGNAFSVALQHLALLRTDAGFRGFVWTRILLLSVALAPPYYILLAQAHTGGGVQGLGWLVVAAGLGASISSPFWGRMGDRSSRTVMALAAGGAGVLGLAAVAASWLELPGIASPWPWAAAILLLTVLHSGVRLGRKIYLVDMATAENRAALVAVSNTVIGVAMLLAGALGVVGNRIGAVGMLLLLSLLAFLAAGRARHLPEVSD